MLLEVMSETAIQECECWKTKDKCECEFDKPMTDAFKIKGEKGWYIEINDDGDLMELLDNVGSVSIRKEKNRYIMVVRDWYI